MFYEVVPTRLFRQNTDGILTYSYDPSQLKNSTESVNPQKTTPKTPTPLQPGQVVRIPIGRSIVNGIIWRQAPRPNFPTKPISKIITTTPLPPHLLKAIQWLSDYYFTPPPHRRFASLAGWS